ncbi:ABC transporter ATP-binding protein [Paenibacillus spongiae]|uniref:ABC transporter ATP-binding protein/permease n=1 Tax=Paenibacillus spongiae TaxID=2909671 RepID=A0ABY5SGD3_9BACL|nr:ABC transporter ATP-binding protein [Paenibacillus spongiae]UVI33054.1 ABC transporter ATP-binding protein/permease [Paenibacillus spongiae]
MNITTRAGTVRSIGQLICRISRAMPVLTLIWLGIPLLLGVLIIPGYAAQKDLIDLFIGGSDGRDWESMLKEALLPLIIFTGVALIRSLLAACQNAADPMLSDRASMLLQSELHRRAIRVPLERMDQSDYYDRLQRAETVAGGDVLGILKNVIVFLTLLFELIGLLIVVSLAHPVVCILLVIVYAISFIIRLESDIVVRRMNRDLTRSGRQSDYLREVVTKPETVKEMRIFGSIGYLIDKWHDTMRQSLSLRMNARRREIKRGMIISAVQIAGLFGAIMWMALNLGSGGFTAGTLVIVFLAMRQAYGISGRMVHPISKIYIQSTKIMDLNDYLKESSAGDEADKEGIAPPLPNPGTSCLIEFDNVTYQYSGAQEPALHEIRLTLNPGETVALVGENGAGKSTLVRLLLGLYQPTSGRIIWDGVDMRALDPVKLSSSMSAVFQDFVRYETVLRDNVGFGFQEQLGKDAYLRRALQAGGAGSLESECGGLDSPVGLLAEGGRELSGGQWQRLAIARAALRSPKLLVLDEPTAALDPQHETELYRSFRELAQGRTTLFVSHRLGWARYADRIIVMRGGRIVEEGSHETLLKADGVYAAMFRSQAEWYCSTAGEGEGRVSGNIMR